MPMSMQSNVGGTYPALYLYPLNDSFAPKHIGLTPGQHVKIGRQTNAKTTPGERNGYFDSKVLSRQHAEVWADADKIFIKDVKSSNGTFINGERLSLEGLESDPFELKTDDIVEFGIDIVGEDNKTIIHHKVAARVFCVFSEQDAQVAARAEQHSQQEQQRNQQASQQQHQQQQQAQQQFQPPSQPNNSGSSFNFGPQQGQRRPISQGLTGMGGMGGSMRPPGKSGLTFDHILSRLQGEIQKSRETGAELHTLTGAMGEIHDTLGGSLPPTLPPYPHTLPPLARPSQQQQQQQPSPENTSSPEPSSPPPVALNDLQSQLRETQSSLASHVERIHALESALAEQESVKREVRLMREMMESRRRELSSHEEPRAAFDHELDDDEELHSEDDDDSDARSIATIIPHELDRVDEEEETAEDEQPSHASSEEEAAATADDGELEPDSEEARQRQHAEEQSIGRPPTPEPNGLGMSSYRSAPASLDSSVIDDLTSRLATLTSQLESALELSTALQAQHTVAQTTITHLETKVEKLEELVKVAAASSTPSPAPVSQPTAEPALSESSLTAILNDWKKTVEGQWSSVQEEWKVERERLAKAREEWEAKTQEYERNNSTASWAMLNSRPNHEKRNGLVTPPSPRSLSADSNRRTRKRRSSARRGRSRSGSRSSRGDADTDATLASNDTDTTKVDKEVGSGKEKEASGTRHVGLVTPESSLRGSLSSSLDAEHPNFSNDDKGSKAGWGNTKDANHPAAPLAPGNVNMQTAAGVLVLSIAAAAVIWRVKPGAQP